MNKNDIIAHIKKINNLNYISSLLEWDQETHMPPKAALRRSEQLSVLAGIQSDLSNSKDFQDSLFELNIESCDNDEKVIIREAILDTKKSRLVPKALKEEIAKFQSLGQRTWVEARETNDYELFKPYLEKLISLKKEYAESISELYPGKSEYEILLDEYEPGISLGELDNIFSYLKPELISLIAKIKEKQKSLPNFPSQYNLDLQEEFAINVIEDIGFDFERGRIDLSAHPFCTNFSVNDVRITTVYDEKDFSKSFFSLLHETGHALYELGMNDDFHGTALAMPISLGIHESQSRFWENNIGRSREFWTYYLPSFKNMFKKEFKNIRFDDFLKKINFIKAGPIRIDADELTYNFHILIRYELERDLFNGTLSANDLPDAWNKKYRDYLGLQIQNYSDGCLQDVHWSLGLFGYFPTYTLGNLYAAQIYEHLKKNKPAFSTEISKGKFSETRTWLMTNIHCHGKRYKANEIIKKITDEDLSPKYFIQYLENKFNDLYQL